MAFPVVVMEGEAFERWLSWQARPAAPPGNALAARGRELFLASGCHACHAVRGTAAAGVTGPDLTHAGSRLSLGAGTLSTTPEAIRRWIAVTEEVKPGVHMPSFGMLPAGDLAAIAAYVEELE
jgi:cytochrome c oxidase subunit II